MIIVFVYVKKFSYLCSVFQNCEDRAIGQAGKQKAQ